MRDEPRLPAHIATIPNALDFWVVQTPDAPALRSTDGCALSRRALHEVIDRVGQRLVTLGVARDEPVALVLPAELDMGVTLLGIMSRAVAMPLDPASSASELTCDLERLRPNWW
jgi:acyl-CoA synthetase (AMP-forming)/AMP-acid ligase II